MLFDGDFDDCYEDGICQETNPGPSGPADYFPVAGPNSCLIWFLPAIIMTIAIVAVLIIAMVNFSPPGNAIEVGFKKTAMVIIAALLIIHTWWAKSDQWKILKSDTALENQGYKFSQPYQPWDQEWYILVF